MSRLRLISLLAGFVVLLGPVAADAAFFTGTPIDGPSADLVSVGGVDLARHGYGTVVYVKRDGGIPHIFASRFVGGTWQAPERLDPGLVLPSSSPVVGVADGPRTVVAFLNGTELYTISRRPADKAWPAPVALASNAASPSIDISVNGVAYVAWSSGGDVRAATLGRTDRAWTPLGAPLDANPAQDAGSGAGRPSIAASADGTALAAWGENGHVYARRVLHTVGSAVVSDLTMPTLGGHAGGTADSPVADQGDDSSFGWVAFRQTFDGGATSQVLIRRLVGSAFDPPAQVGPGFGGEATDAPALDVNGEGVAVFASETASSHVPFGLEFYPATLHPPLALSGGSTVPAEPQVGVGSSSQATFAWLGQAGAGAPVVVRARGFKRNTPSDAEKVLSDPSLGSVDPAGGFFASADRSGDTLLPYLQGTDAGRRLMAAGWDRVPGFVALRTSQSWRRPLPVAWGASTDVWGPITYDVVVDGHTIGSTPARTLPIAGLVADGRHTLRVVAVDGHGQRRSSHTQRLLIDSRPPSLRLSIAGAPRAGAPVRLTAKASDPRSGVARVKFHFDDGAVAVARVTRHAFSAGRHVVTVTATDRAGNARVLERTVRVG